MIVVDTNVVAYFLFEGGLTRNAELLRSREKRWMAPALLRHELLSVMMQHVKTRRVDVDTASRKHRQGVSLVEFVNNHADVREVLSICEKSGCSSYDAEYVWLAQELRVPLITADRKLLSLFPDTATMLSDFAA